MKPLPIRARQTVRCIATVALFCAATLAGAQSHERTEGGYTVRSSTVSSMMLDEGAARRHGIPRSPDTGVLNVVVMRHPSGETVAADVSATARALTGRAESIRLKEISANGFVSYTGTYSYVPREVLDFIVAARPRAEPSREISLTYRDRMRQPGDAPR